MLSKHSEQTQTFTHLSKVNITQTLLYYREAQLYWEEQVGKEIFEQTTKADFLEVAESAYNQKKVAHYFALAIEKYAQAPEEGIALFNKLQETYPFTDIYDAIESNFVFYFLDVNVDIATFTDPKSKDALQKHYNEVHACYSEIILFIKKNKI